MTTPFRFGYRLLSKAFQTPRRVAPRRRLRPTVTALEGRALLSMLTVSNINDTGTGSLRAAVAQADADGGGDMIVFSSLFNTPQRITLTSGPLDLTGITAPTTITGPGANLLSVSGNNSSMVFRVDPNVTASISGLTITGGNSRFGEGGGLFNYGTATLTLTNCTVSGNSAIAEGGGLFNLGTATLTNCTVTGNSANDGGGLFNAGTATLTNFTVTGNSTGDDGGGLFNYGRSPLTLTNCTVSGNYAYLGGGLSNIGTATLTNCTVSGNSASDGGGGLWNDGTATLTNCTVSGNSAAYSYGGLFNLGTATLTNTIVAGNTTLPNGGGSSSDIGGTVSVSGSYNLIGTGGSAGLTNGVNHNQVGVANPLLGPLGDYGGPTPTIPLLPGSPAIGIGSPALAVDPSTGQALTADQRGYTQSGVVDIGAFQDQGFVLAPVAGSTPQLGFFGTAFANPLAVTVTANNTSQFTNPVAGGVIGFTVNPAANGASATLSAATATITGSQASVTATANTLAGSYTVRAAAAGVSTPASFTLTQSLPATGISVIGTVLYLVGGSTSSDVASVKPAGAKTDGSTGLTVGATLNGVSRSKSFTQTFTAIILAGYAGNETFTLAPSLTLPATVTAGNGNDVLKLGGGNNTVVLGDGNDTVADGNGNNTVTVGNGNDTIQLGGGNNTVTVGNGNDTIQLGGGSNVVVEGNGNDSVSAGNGNNLIVGGLGRHTITVGNGTNILIDGSATVDNSGDSFRQILNAWTANPTASNQGAIRQQLTVNYNALYHNTLTAGSGIDWFFYQPPTTSNKKSTDFWTNKLIVRSNWG